MRTRVFFSFYYSRDRHRTRQVMDRWLAEPGAEATPFIARGELERMIHEGLPAIYRWVEEEVAQADVCVALIGADTAGRHFVEYEVAQAIRQGKPLLGVTIHGVPDHEGRVDPPGRNPLFPIFPVYDWVEDDGPGHLPRWIEEARREQAGSVATFAPLFASGALTLPD